MWERFLALPNPENGASNLPSREPRGSSMMLAHTTGTVFQQVKPAPNGLNAAPLAEKKPSDQLNAVDATDVQEGGDDLLLLVQKLFLTLEVKQPVGQL